MVTGNERTIRASDFKARCLALLDQVERTKVPLVVTKRGKPVAKVVPLDDEPRKPIMGSVLWVTDDEEELFTPGKDIVWNADVGVMLPDDKPRRRK